MLAAADARRPLGPHAACFVGGITLFTLASIGSALATDPAT